MNISHYRHKNQGFTLIELLITLVIAAILMSLAAPSFSDAMRNSRQVSTVNELMGTMKLARSEAIKQATRTAVCAREDDSTCGTDWSNGYITFTDAGPIPGQIDPDETILRLHAPLKDGATIQNNARVTSANDLSNKRPFIRFGPRGTSNWRGAGFFIVCDSTRDPELTRGINISLSGDPRRARREEGVLRTTFGGEADCGEG